uniref:Gamma-interferon-inducible lysosomal thiol reductase n=1 Tax=Alexandrium andersonii TaxID=327968 RepID=A0A7S2JEU8_9DINO|mmetsp:Transcript_99185/g.222236  ORF Transcript_99185/g.222236 Transcript_99185/m.222236 type:complete len:276 (+) Transcript_99185:81-908(+)
MVTSRSAMLAFAFAGLAIGALGIQGDSIAVRRESISQHAGTVQLDLFYESMCPYCHMFINDTLKDLWQDTEMRALVDLRLHPAGNLQALDARSVSKGYFFWHPERKSDKYIYLCQHGESECLGNLIHMCAKKVLSADTHMSLLFCMAKNTESVPEKSSFACMQELSIEPTPVKDCVFSPSANEEMMDIVQADAELDPPRKYVPWVVVNGKHIEIEHGKAELRQAICDALAAKGDSPAACKNKPSTALASLARLEGGEGQAAPRAGVCHPGRVMSA